MLSYKGNWGVASNIESGEGYYDIAIEIEDEEIGMIIEVKYAEKEDFEGECKKALQQINDKGYTEELKEDGMRTLLKYGIACNKKRCRIMLEQEDDEKRSRLKLLFFFPCPSQASLQAAHSFDAAWGSEDNGVQF